MSKMVKNLLDQATDRPLTNGLTGSLPGSESGGTRNPWFAFHTPNLCANIRLFCFPYAGGGASIYRDWARILPNNVEVFPVQLPGREGRLNEQAFTEPTLLTDMLVEVLLPYLDEPFIFFGHSLGARTCFEVARGLRRLGKPLPTRLFVSGCRAPQIESPEPPIHQLPDAEFTQKLRAYNGTPELILTNAELMELFLPIIRTDFELSENYRYCVERPLEIPLTAYGGIADGMLSREHVAAWKEQTRKTFQLRMFPGDHFFLHSHRQMVIETFSRDILSLVLA